MTIDRIDYFQSLNNDLTGNFAFDLVASATTPADTTYLLDVSQGIIENGRVSISGGD